MTSVLASPLNMFSVFGLVCFVSNLMFVLSSVATVSKSELLCCWRLSCTVTLAVVLKLCFFYIRGLKARGAGANVLVCEHKTPCSNPVEVALADLFHFEA